MKVYKAYFKIVKNLLPQIILFTVIFLGFAILTSTVNQPAYQTFEGVKPAIAFFNHDEGDLGVSLQTYLEKTTKIVKIEENDTTVRDALFVRQIEYAITVPSGFTKSLEAGLHPKLVTLSVPDSSSAYLITNYANQFLNIASIYQQAGEKGFGTKVLSDLDHQITVHQQQKESLGNLASVTYYMNFSSYVYLSLFVLVIGVTMQAYHQDDVKKRNLCSPISLKSTNRQLLLGHASITGIIWLAFTAIALILYPEAMFTERGLLMILTSFVFVVTALSLAFFLGTLIKNVEVLNSVANVVALGASFISGVFVPQALLGSSVLTIGQFLPPYWFVKANDLVRDRLIIDADFFQNYLLCIGVLFAFAILFYVLTFFYTKKMRKKMSW